MKKNDDTANSSININNSGELITCDNDSSLYNNNVSFKNKPNDDDLTKIFKEFLETSQQQMEIIFLNRGKNEIERMRTEGSVKKEIVENKKDKIKKEKSKIKENKKVIIEKNQVKDNHTHLVNGYHEYDYSDDELKEDDKKIKEDYEAIVTEYRRNVIRYFYF